MEKVAQRMSICQIFNKLYVNVKYCTACGLCRVNVICNESHDIKQNFTIPEFLNNTIMDKRMAFLGKLLVQLPTVTFPAKSDVLWYYFGQFSGWAPLHHHASLRS